MDQTTLKWLRLFIPGILIVIVGYIFILIITGKKFEDLDLSEYSFPALGAFILGAFYQTFNIRYIVTNFTHKQIDLNIKKNILKLYTANLTQTQIQYLYKNDTLKNIFYDLIDNNSSLSIKAKNVYFNGLLLSSFADAFIISIFSCLGILIFTFFNSHNVEELKELMLFLIIIAFISMPLHFLSFLNHIKISNSQLEFIENNYISDIKTKIDNILTENNVQ